MLTRISHKHFVDFQNIAVFQDEKCAPYATLNFPTKLLIFVAKPDRSSAFILTWELLLVISTAA
jgi:hypothetical protein